ncbi:MAG: flagellar basal body rod protein FlgC [Deltaproteobacteria bacterium]|nr:flagellar basal body rod protein FlgC [Deltaproteobacteria bacterium]MCB9787789.1 flagellar basal body rod protein FlgC [Deltaproteobacteria bacterium]
MFRGLDIAASGMAAQRARLNVVSSNIANASTTRTEDGGPYQRQEIVFEAIARKAGQSLEGGPAIEGEGVRVVGIQEDPSPGPLVYDPGHPDADADGNVRLPNINLVEEMVDMISASRSFESSAQAFNTVRDMALRALEIGR